MSEREDIEAAARPPKEGSSDPLSEIDRRALAYRNRQMRSAFWRGVKAFDAGLTLADCPYTDVRSLRGHATFARAFLKAWHDGFRLASCRKPYRS